MTFKKDGTDPMLDRKAPMISLNWVGEVARALGLIADLDADRRSNIRNHDRYPSKRPATPPRKRRNMLLVSKRVRRKHRRATRS